MSAMGIDRRDAKRVVPMRALCLGMSRTGTNSLRAAMQMLDFKATYHGFACYAENPKDFDLWEEAMDAKFEGKGEPYTREKWDALLGHCQAVTDIPCVLFAEELLEAYPEAKVVITNRDFDSWYHSMNTVLYPHFQKFENMDLFNWLVPTYRQIRQKGYRVWDYLFEHQEFNPEVARKVYDKYYANLRHVLATKYPNREVLEYDVKQGWDPLCTFLEVPVPKEDFPNKNDSKSMTSNVKQFKDAVKNEMMVNLGKVVGVASVSSVLALQYYNRR